MATIKVKRIYEAATPDDGLRVLVDRVWPRGVSKVKANVDLWLKSVAPSTVLRKWFNHDPQKWGEFKKRYFAELDGRSPELEQLRKRTGKQAVTLVYSARDLEHNQAVALKDYIERALKR